jgi:hypothetical protein
MGFYLNAYKGKALPARGKGAALRAAGATRLDTDAIKNFEDMLDSNFVCVFDPGQPWDCALYVGENPFELARIINAHKQHQLIITDFLNVPDAIKELPAAVRAVLKKQ